MAVVIIVEDGSNVPGANSYVSVTEYREYAEQRNITLPVSNDVVGSQLIQAMDYLAIQAWSGKPTYTDQTLDFPRAPNDYVPDKIKSAQMQLALQVNAGVELFPVSGGSAQIVAREKVGPLETEYSTTNVGTQPYFKSISALIGPFLGSVGFGQFRAVRG